MRLLPCYPPLLPICYPFKTSCDAAVTLLPKNISNSMRKILEFKTQPSLSKTEDPNMSTLTLGSNMDTRHSTSIRIPPDLLDLLKNQARLEHRGVTQLIIHILRLYYEDQAARHLKTASTCPR